MTEKMGFKPRSDGEYVNYSFSGNTMQVAEEKPVISSVEYALGFLSSLDFMSTDQLEAIQARISEKLGKQDQVTKLEAEVMQLRAEIEILSKKQGSKHKQKDKNTTVEWYTPNDPYISMVRKVFGGKIDTDPASNEMAQSWIQADLYFTKETDGLANSHLWKGLVFCNPPYGNEPKKWISEAVKLYQAGQIKGAIFLINRSGSNWFRQAKKDLSAVCQVHKRIKFVNQEGAIASSPMYDNDFLCIGTEIADEFERVFSTVGDVTMIQ